MKKTIFFLLSLIAYQVSNSSQATQHVSDKSMKMLTSRIGSQRQLALVAANSATDSKESTKITAETEQAIFQEQLNSQALLLYMQRTYTKEQLCQNLKDYRAGLFSMRLTPQILAQRPVNIVRSPLQPSSSMSKLIPSASVTPETLARSIVGTQIACTPTASATATPSTQVRRSVFSSPSSTSSSLNNKDDAELSMSHITADLKHQAKVAQYLSESPELRPLPTPAQVTFVSLTPEEQEKSDIDTAIEFAVKHGANYVAMKNDDCCIFM